MLLWFPNNVLHLLGLSPVMVFQDKILLLASEKPTLFVVILIPRIYKHDEFKDLFIL